MRCLSRGQSPQARTLWRDLDVEWSGIEIILKLAGELADARRRIAELEAALDARR